MNFIFRKAKITDIANLESLIKKSATAINSAYYSQMEIDAALGNAWTVDRQLIVDNTYWIVENSEGVVVGCGGWSKRKLLFEKCETEARSFGFASLELVATLSGEKLYLANGFTPLKSYEIDLGKGI